MLRGLSSNANLLKTIRFFEALADKSQRRLFQNAAARGKVGSGGTAEALQTSLLEIGTDLVNTSIKQRLAGLGARQSVIRQRHAQAGVSQQQSRLRLGQEALSLDAAKSTADLFSSGGDVAASGIVGERNAETDALGNIISTGVGLFSGGGLFNLSDARTKENKVRIGKTGKGIAIYRYNYIGETDTRFGPMAHEVERVIPDAVVTIDDLKYVDFKKVA